VLLAHFSQRYNNADVAEAVAVSAYVGIKMVAVPLNVVEAFVAPRGWSPP
jgi:hypothetical protein